MKLNGDFMKSRKFKHGSMSVIITVGFVAVVVIINIIANLLLDRFPIEFDLTDDQIYSLNDDSIDYLETVDDDITMYVCIDESTLQSYAQSSTIYKQAYEIIKQYDKNSSNISVKYVDIVAEPNFPSAYPDYTVDSGSIVVESSKRVRVIGTINDLFETSYDANYNTIYYSKAEEVLTSAVMYVTDEELTKVNVLTGHNSDVDTTALVSLLETNNYEVEEVNILTTEIDSDVNMLILPEPATDFSDEELKMLDDYLSNNDQFGKNVLYLASPSKPELPNLAQFLSEWGIQIDDGFVAETEASNAYGNYFAFGADIQASDYIQELTNTNLPFISYYSRPVSALWEENSNRTTSVLLSSPSSALIYPDDADENFTSDDAVLDAYGLAVMGERYRTDGTEKLASTVTVFGSGSMFVSDLVSSGNYLNGEYIIEYVNNIVGKENTLNIVSVDFSDETLVITQSTYNIMYALFVVIVPIAFLALGIVVWLTRRNR